MAENRRGEQNEQSLHQVKRIDELPDDVLLGIFDFYVDMSLSYRGRRRKEAWTTLVHVCRQWRSLVFQSPRRLNLQLYCTHGGKLRDTLDVWPALPLVVVGDTPFSGLDNVIAALEHSNRVCQVEITGGLVWHRFEEVLAVMQVPFPELTNLWLYKRAYRETPWIIHDSFLGGSAPRLQHVYLDGIPFPGLPKLLLSANHLVDLGLRNIPRSGPGYIFPGAMVALLSALSSLKTLILGFKFPESSPDLESRCLSPPKYPILPSLHKFRFYGVTEYLEDLVTFINAPQLNYFYITFFGQFDFYTPRLVQFINRTPTLRARDEAHVQFCHITASIELRAGSGSLDISISCRRPLEDWQLRSIEQVCDSSLHPLSTVEDLYIEHQYPQLVWLNDTIEDINTQWLELLLRFTGVKNLYLSKEYALGVTAALQELVGGRITEVLPSLQNIFVEELEPLGPLQENIGRFVAARQLSNHRSIAISVWDKDSKRRPM